MLDLPAVGLQKLSKLSVCARVQYAEARRKLRPKSKNLQGKEAALTHTNGHTGPKKMCLLVLVYVRSQYFDHNFYLPAVGRFLKVGRLLLDDVLDDA